jgi:hypothetical protein
MNMITHRQQRLLPAISATGTSTLNQLVSAASALPHARIIKE